MFAEEKRIKYRSTWITVLVGMVFTIFASLALRYFFIRENARRDRLSGTQEPTVEGEKDGAGEAYALPESERVGGYEDKTDKERPEFRYTL